MVANPALEILSEYVPGATFGKTYWPAEFVVTDLVSFVAVFASSAVASGTTAPPGSVTVPRTWAVLAVWGHAGAVQTMPTSKTYTTAILLRILMLPPPTL